MALAIGVKENDVIYVGNVRVTVVSTEGFERAEVEVGQGDGLSNPRGSCRVYSYIVTDKKATEILPGVFVSCGRPDQRFLDKHNRMQRDFDAARARGEAGVNPGKLLPRLIFEAPRSITILRKELYERSDRERLARRIADENDIPVERARALVK